MTKKKNYALTITLCALFSALIAVGAFIKIPIPIIPFTLQTLFVTLAGMLLGKKLGSISVLVYIVIGLIGIPVFTKGGGISYVLQPTFGYILGFVLSAFLTGLIIHKVSNPSYARIFVGGLTGLLAVYAVGVPYFYLISTYFLGNVIAAKVLLFNCFLMTLPGDIFFLILATILSHRLIPLTKKYI
ncbi:MAG: biotin transporter BioY [Oscillospiraceae bacterium]